MEMSSSAIFGFATVRPSIQNPQTQRRHQCTWKNVEFLALKICRGERKGVIL